MRKRVAFVAGTAGVATGLLAITRLARGWFPVRVAGDSMLPVISHGDWLAVRGLRPSEPREGQIVVVRHDGGEIVKRVSRVIDASTCWVEGDNPAASTDSRVFGAIKREAVAGVVRARYKPVRNARRFD